MVKELFEKNKNIICVICICVCLSIISICTAVTVVSVRRANNEVSSIRTELERERETVDRCRKTVGTIAGGLAEDTSELRDVINKLRVVSDGVKTLENILYSNNISFTNSNCDSDNTLENK